MKSHSQNELSEIANALIEQRNSGVLATISVKQTGFPFASQAPFALLERAPLFLFSDLSVHSKNLRSTDKATLLIQAGDDIQEGRASLMGHVKRIDDASIEQAKEQYLAAHPDAAQWISFGDFRFYEMSVIDIYVVAGFGKAGWVKPAA